MLEPDDLSKEEFVRLFRKRMVEEVGETFDDGTDVAKYADEVAPTYYDHPGARQEGPDECAMADLYYGAQDAG